MADLEFFQIPALEDNYIYVLRNHGRGLTAVIDPALALPVLEFLREKNWGLDFIWNTHHHPDHVGGNAELKAATGCRILAFEGDRHRIPGCDQVLTDHEVFDFGAARVLVRHVPGHTSGHIAFFIPDKNWLFCGDTLFAMGCGRLFEGTPAQMWESLQWFKTLPPETLAFCTHEYTLTNGLFAQTVEPHNERLDRRVDRVKELRKKKLSTVPFRLQEELATNPFLRTGNARIQEHLDLAGAAEVQVFAALRKMKDRFQAP